MRLDSRSPTGLVAGAAAAAVLVPLGLGLGPGAGPAAAPRLLEPAHGAALRGTVSVRADADPLVEYVLFDASTDGGRTWIRIARDTDLGDGWGTRWATGSYTGRAVIRATDSLGGQTHVRVRVDNELPVLHLRSMQPTFSPNGDGLRDVAELRFSADEAVTVTLQVLGPGGRVVHTAARDLYVTSRRLRQFVWDGLLYGGFRRGGDGLYSIRALAVDAVGNRGSQASELLLDTRAPLVSLRSLSPERIESGPVRIGLNVSDAADLVRVTPALYDARGKRLGVFPTSLRRPGSFELVVQPGAAETALAPGAYEVGVTVIDSAGNAAEASRKPFLVVHAVDASVWARFDGAGLRAALTFDDCLDAGPWASILDTLKRYHVKATFFCPGQRVLANQALALRTVREGHSIGAHGWDHANFSKLSYGSQLQRLVDDREVWWRLAKVSPLPLFRPPYGAYTATTAAAAGAAGYSALILWDVDPLDWHGPGAGAIEERVVGRTRPGSIVLLHTVWQTASALPSTITRLQARGYRLVSLPALAAVGTPTNAHWRNY